MQLKILHSSTGKLVRVLNEVSGASTIYDVKKMIYKTQKYMHPSRQGLRLDTHGKFLDDDMRIRSIEFKEGAKQLYIKDLGYQIGWKNVFLLEYAGPLILYIATYYRPSVVYGTDIHRDIQPVVHIAAACWIIHYSKRLLETLYVHRFSHATMPVRNLFKNCSYYWLFGLFIGYYVNHPLYTAPTFGNTQVYIGLAGFILAELGNLSIHLALRNLRPSGTLVRKIPVETGNPFTALFKFVSCPNYTYEVLSWIFFTAMTQCLPAGIFAFAGMYQMTLWALGKHRNYKKEFFYYPKTRKAIFPFIV